MTRINTDLATITASIGAGGIPDDLQTSIIQVLVGLVTWALTRLFNKSQENKNVK